MARSERFLFTARPGTEKGAARVDDARTMVRVMNAQLKANGRPDFFQVQLSPRRIAPEHAWKYDNRFAESKRMRAEDADFVDVYVVGKQRKGSS